MNNIDEILEEIDELMEKATSMPFSNSKILVDGERLRDLIDDIRRNIPAEIKRAKLIDFDCERIMKEAEQKAEAIVQKAEERAKNMVSNDAIIKDAKQKAVEILSQAQNRSKEIKNATNDYVDNLLANAESYFATGLQDVKKTKNEINRVKNGNKNIM